MQFRIAFLTAVASVLSGAACVAAPTVEVASLAGPHGTAPREWLQRLDEAGAGATRLVSAGSTNTPRLVDLGATADGRPLVKVYAVLTRSGELLLPGAGGAERYRLGDREKLAGYFRRLDQGGTAAVTTPRGKYGLTEAEFTDLFTRLQKPLPPLGEGATLADAVASAKRAARVAIEVEPAVRPALQAKAEGAAALEGLATGTALAALLRQEGLALQGEPSTPVVGGRRGSAPTTGVVGSPGRLRIVAALGAEEPWPVGYDPERSPRETAPVLFEFLTVEVEGYTLTEAFDAIGPRLTWNGRPLPIVWDHFALRRDAIDPSTTDVRFPRGRTFYLKLLDRLAFQARLKVDLRVDEAGQPLLYLTR